MISATRRRFFALVGATPIAAKAAADRAAADLTRVDVSGCGAANNVPSSWNDGPTPEQFRRALSNPFTRRMIEDIVYEEERVVYRIDPDLAAFKSFSLNAKIAFQRQRNVETRFRIMREGYAWNRVANYVRKALGLSIQ